MRMVDTSALALLVKADKASAPAAIAVVNKRRFIPVSFFTLQKMVYLRHVSVLHAPAANGAFFNGGENKVLDHQSDHDDKKQASKDVGGLQLVAVLEDVPAQSAAAGRDTEHQLGRNQ